ncbi:MAG: RsmE family RNA methyltransferase [Treponema sp.]|nr:RsmE family RNA methyltransferase [Treponema sp.]
MRQFVSAVAPNSKGLLEISGKDFHYLRKVLRLAVGDMINLSLPGGLLQGATVCKVDDRAKKIALQVCGTVGSGENSSQDKNAARSNGLQDLKGGASRTFMTLLQFIPKPQKMELIVRQAAECGIANVIPVIGEYTQAGSEKPLQKTDRFDRIVREARQQSGSQVETKIFPPMKLSEALELIERGDLSSESDMAKIFFYERGEKTVSLLAALLGKEQDGSQAQDAAAAATACVYAVGSEGGISPAECELLFAKGYKAVHFNTNILRCETAALYAAAAIQSALDN